LPPEYDATFDGTFDQLAAENGGASVEGTERSVVGTKGCVESTEAFVASTECLAVSTDGLVASTGGRVESTEAFVMSTERFVDGTEGLVKADVRPSAKKEAVPGRGERRRATYAARSHPATPPSPKTASSREDSTR
jgi:hypothetical protein